MSSNTHTYHKGEGLGGDCFVVLMDAVPYTHFYLRLLHPVTRGIIQPTHNPEKGEQKGGDYDCYQNKCFLDKQESSKVKTVLNR